MTLRDTFDEAPELYDRMRPGYPPELFDDLERLASLETGSRVLELGLGTGQATGGARPARVRGDRRGARERPRHGGPPQLAAFPGVRVVHAAFEEWPLPGRPFDAVVAATSFHWLDPAVRVTKAADALRPGGALAVISTHHVAGGDVDFFAAAQRCYERWMPGAPPGLQLEAAAAIPTGRDELAGSGRFREVVLRRYEREQMYTTREYLDLLCTYSGHRALDPGERHGLLDCIADLIDGRFGGRIAKRYLTELALAVT